MGREPAQRVTVKGTCEGDPQCVGCPLGWIMGLRLSWGIRRGGADFTGGDFGLTKKFQA